MFKEFFRVIKDDKLKIILDFNSVNIINYSNIEDIKDNKIIIKANSKFIIIEGLKLVVSKLMDDEILISGKINKIEFR